MESAKLVIRDGGGGGCAYLLDCGEHHVTTAGCGQPVEPAADAVDCDDVEVLTPRVVSTVHDGPHGASKGDAELGSRGSSTTSLRHPGLSGK